MSQPGDEFPAAIPHDGPSADDALPLGYAAPSDTPRRHSRLAWVALTLSLTAPATLAGIWLAIFWGGYDTPPDWLRRGSVLVVLVAPLVSLALSIVALLLPKRQRAVAIVALLITCATLTYYVMILMLWR